MSVKQDFVIVSAAQASQRERPSQWRAAEGEWNITHIMFLFILYNTTVWLSTVWFTYSLTFVPSSIFQALWR